MATDKKAMWVVFRMDEMISTAELRERFAAAYDIFRDMPGLFSKTWWINQEKKEWGALYVFNSQKEQEEYANSDLWLNKVPAKWGVTPEVTVLEVAAVLTQAAVTKAEKSWETN